MTTELDYLMEFEIQLNIDHIWFSPLLQGSKKMPMCSLRCEPPERRVSADVAEGWGGGRW